MGGLRDLDQMAQQCGANAFALVLIAHEECHLGFSLLNHDVPCTADNSFLSSFFRHCQQGHVVFEVNIEKERLFSLREIPLQCEEPAVKRNWANPSDG